MKSIKRRTFLKAGATAAMAAAVVPVQAAEPVSTVVVVHGEDIPKMIAAGIAKMGGWEKFVKPGAKVALKPNLAWKSTPGRGDNTHPAIVREGVLAAEAATALKRAARN